MEQEIWKDIPNYVGLYQASNLGRIKSLSRVEVRKDNSPNPIKERILKQSISTTGYFFLNLSNKRVIKSYKVHRLIALTFLPLLDTKNDVNHIDGNKLNNNVKNLEWVTRSENSKHAYSLGLKRPLSGELNPKSKITNKQASDIRIKYIPYVYTIGKLSMEYGIDASIILGIIKNKRYTI